MGLREFRGFGPEMYVLQPQEHGPQQGLRRRRPMGHRSKAEAPQGCYKPILEEKAGDCMTVLCIVYKAIEADLQGFCIG